MPIALKRVLRLAERQWGVVARWQLEQHGLSAAAISRWAASGRLHRIYPGAYAVGHRAICAEGRLLAAILYAGPGAALSHASAASWWQLIPYLPDTTHVLSPIRRRSLKGVHVHHPKHIERVMHRGLAVTPVARTLLDLASVAPLDRVRKAVAEADYRRLLDLHAIDAMTGVGRAGAGPPPPPPRVRPHPEPARGPPARPLPATPDPVPGGQRPHSRLPSRRAVARAAGRSRGRRQAGPRDERTKGSAIATATLPYGRRATRSGGTPGAR